MMNVSLALFSWALVATAVFSSIPVTGFGSHALPTFGAATTRFNSRATANRMPTSCCGHFHIPCNDEEETNLASGRFGEARDSDNDTRQTRNFAIRSTLASALALALIICPFVETATAESIAAAPAMHVSQTTAVAASSSSKESPSTRAESANSPAGNAVLGAWIGISGFAGVKGIYDRIQQEQE